jgi:hypothetical protein
MTENKSVFCCNVCNKKYKSYNSLGNHNRKFHNSIQSSPNVAKFSLDIANYSLNIAKNSENNMTNYNCRLCNKIYNNYKSRWTHEKKCKNKNNLLIIKNDELTELKNKIIELENKISNNNIITNNTNNGITNTNNGTTNTNNGTINNTTNTTNNIIKISLGDEDMQVLSKSDKKMIMNSGFSSMIRLIETIHLNNNYKQFQNVQIPNLKDKYAKCYDDKINNFITKSKIEIIDEIIAYRTMNLKEIHGKYNKNTIKHNNVLKLINKIENYTSDDDDDKLTKFYKDLCEEITLLFYNKSKIFK